jgi:pimeloyl-ACP methyl ester carboxylesterase
MGAMAAVAWSHRYPGEVELQVLINTSMRPFSPFYMRLRPRNYLTLLRLMAVPATAWQWEHAVLQMTTHLHHTEVLAYWQWLREQCPVSRSNALRQLWAAARYHANLQRPTAATLLLVSARDALVSATCSHRLAAAWCAEIAVHPNAGHDLTLDDSSWVVKRIGQWLEHRNDITLSHH